MIMATGIMARPMIAWPAASPSSPAPSARRYAALGLDRSLQPSKLADRASDALVLDQHGEPEIHLHRSLVHKISDNPAIGTEPCRSQVEAHSWLGMVDQEVSIQGLPEGPSTQKDHRLSPAGAAQPNIKVRKTLDATPLTWMTDVLTKLVNLWPASRIDELMPWTYAKRA